MLMYPQQNNTPSPNRSDYDFIVNSPPPLKRHLTLGNSLATRLIIVSLGIFLLLIIFVVVKGLLSNDTSSYPSLIKAARLQQEIIHISSGATTPPIPASESNQNIAITTELSLASSRSQLLAYIGRLHGSVNKKQLISVSITPLDAQLTAAITANTYDSTFDQVLKQELTAYQQSLKLAYQKTTNTKGRELLNNEYNKATLLLGQIASSNTVQ